MPFFRFRSLFSKLFVSIMLALIVFAAAMIFLNQVVQNNDNSVRSKVLAHQVSERITPILQDLNQAESLLDTRMILSFLKNSIDSSDYAIDAKMGVYNAQGLLLVQTEGSDLPKQRPERPSWYARTFPTLAGLPPAEQVQVYNSAGYTLLFESRKPPESSPILNLFTGTLLLLLIMIIATWWLAHSLTWRINRMSKYMAQLGEGDFSVRVPIDGRDEISTLAVGFNQSAEKIEKLIDANNLLLAHASHEIRTPITRIRLQVEMMDMIASQLPEDSKAMFNKRATAINRDLTGLNDLVESILLVSRLDAGHALQQVENFDLYDLIQQESQHYSDARFYGERIKIDGQPKLITHLIRNLLNNAMIHGTPPVQIYLYATESITQADIIPNYIQTAVDNIATSSTTSSNKTKKKTKRNNKKQRQQLQTHHAQQNYVALAVVDQGNGIPEDKREDIFSPFVRLQQEKKGSGLGLSLVAQIVEAHGGKIMTDTWQGHTRFLVCLPTKQMMQTKTTNIHATTT